MIADFADLCTYVYVLTDETYRAVAAPHDRRPGPRSAFTDRELIALTIAAELLGLEAETRFLAYVRRNHAPLFPLRPERSRYNRRRRQPVEVTNRIRGAIMARLRRVLEAEGHDLAVIDSVPVPVVGDHHAAGDHRWWGEADFGRVPATKQRLDGVKLRLLLRHCGLVLDCAPAAANQRDGSLVAQLLADKAGLTALGAKGDIDGPRQGRLAAGHHLALLTPRRKNQRAQLPAALTRALNRFRQITETTNRQLVGQFRLQQNRARSVSGPCARLQAKLTAHTMGLYLNSLLGRPFRALMDLAVI